MPGGNRRAEPEVRRIEVAGRAIGYRRSGAGPPLVLLHGGWSDSRLWRPQFAGLADGFDVIAWDAPGCGSSDRLPGRPALVDYADAVADLVLALGLDRPHLCGLSFGGGLGLAVYQRHPDLVRSLVLVGAYAGWKGSLPAEEVAARLGRVRAELERPPAEWMDGYLPGFFAGPVPPATVELMRTMMSEIDPVGQLALLSAFAEADLTGTLPTVTVPTLLLYGELDARAPRPVADALHAGIPGSTSTLLPGVGHCVNIEAPEPFDAEVRRFLSAVRQ